MDALQSGFQTAPIKLPLTPYQKAINARETIVQIVQQEMKAVSNDKVWLVSASLSHCNTYQMYLMLVNDLSEPWTSTVSPHCPMSHLTSASCML